MIGRVVAGAGALLLPGGLGLIVLSQAGFTLRPLPGDIVVRQPGVVIYLPFVTMLLLSALGTLLWHWLSYLRR